MPKAGVPRAKLRVPRYGRRIRKQYEAILAKAKAKYKCPRCNVQAVFRVRLGVWRCKKCGFEFTGGAWVPQTPTARSNYASLMRTVSQLKKEES